MTKLVKVPLTCPHCGHQQLEPPAVVSAICKECGRHFRVEDLRKPAARKPTRRKAEPQPEGKKVRCFDCETELDVSPTAQSTMCKRCGRYVDLLDYEINNAVSKNFKTRGTFVIQPKGYVFNTVVFAGNAAIKGRLLGKLVAEQTLTLYSTAQIKGSFTAGRLLIPLDNSVHWKDLIKVATAEIEGELVADLTAEHALVVKPKGRLFGNVEAGSVIVEEGGVLVGQVRISPPTNEKHDAVKR